MDNVKKRQTRKPVKQPGQSSSPPFLLIQFGHQQHCAQQDDAPPGWIGGPPPRTLAELADYLDGKLRVFRELPDRTEGDFEESVQRSGLISIHNRRAKPESVRRRLQYALFASRNAIRWLDQQRMAAGRPVGVTDGDGIEQAEDKLSSLLQWIRAMSDGPAVVRANNRKLFPKGLPSNPNLIDLVLRLDSQRDSGKSMNQIAREFIEETEGNDKCAQSLLAQIRRMRRDGRLNL